MKRTKRILAVLFVLAVIILSIIIYAVPKVTGALTKTEILQYGNFKVTNDVTCYFVRNEKVYAAAHGGVINYYIGDGVQVKQGTRILDITPAASGEESESTYQDLITRLGNDDVELSSCLSEFNGITSYYIDGYENYFTPETMRDLHYAEVSKFSLTPVNVVRESTRKGEPLYKICDNGQWHVVCWVDSGDIPKYKVGKSVTINLPLGQVSATITDIIEDGERWLVVFQTNRYYEDFGKVRMAEATVVTSDYNGIIIRNESITTSNGAIGVYIKSKNGDYIFKPIKTIATDGENSLVAVSAFDDDQGKKVNTVDIYDEILKNPSFDQ